MLNVNQFVFFLLGQAPPPKNKFLHKYYRWWSFAPTIMVFFITFLTTRQFFLQVDFYTISKDWTEAIVGHILLFLSNLIILLVIIMPHQHRRIWTKLNGVLIDIEIELRDAVLQPLQLSKFKKRYYGQAIFLLITTAILLSSKGFLHRPLIHWKIELGHCYFRLYKYSVIIHAMLYVHLLNALLSCLAKSNICVDSVACGRVKIVTTSQNVMQNLKKFKYIHYKLFVVAQLVNNIFGWLFVLVIVQSMFDFSHICYWAYQYVDQNEAIYAISMYNFVSHPSVQFIMIMNV